jgi:hypothetical protein
MFTFFFVTFCGWIGTEMHGKQNMNLTFDFKRLSLIATHLL